MKKTLFTVCAILTVCTVIFLACKKSDDKYNQDGTHRQVTYAGQSTASSGGSGNNPNPNNNPSSSGYTTTGTSTTTTTYGSFNDGTSHTFTGSTPCGSATMTGSYSGGTISIAFAAAPTAGTYTLVPSAPGASQAVMTAFGGSTCTGTITVSGTSPVTVTFTSVYYITTNITGSLKCM